jgi:hypothetical protein
MSRTGGYDPRVAENKEHHLELVRLSQSLGLTVSDFPDCSAQVPTDSIGACSALCLHCPNLD